MLTALQVTLDYAHKKKNIRKKLFEKFKEFQPYHEIILSWYDSVMYAVKDHHRVYHMMEDPRGRREDVIQTLDDAGAKSQLLQLYNHLCENHDHCWDLCCIYRIGTEKDLKPLLTITEFSDPLKEKFNKMLISIFTFQPGQNIVTDITTCTNENTNSKHLMWQNKNRDLWATYGMRVDVFTIYHNAGLLALYEFLSLCIDMPLDSIDMDKVRQLESSKVRHMEQNQSSYEKKKTQLKENVELARANLSPLSIANTWILYGVEYPNNDYLPLNFSVPATVDTHLILGGDDIPLPLEVMMTENSDSNYPDRVTDDIRNVICRQCSIFRYNAVKSNVDER